MFEYDARPVTAQTIIVGQRVSRAGYSIRDFLSRNGLPFEWVDIDNTQRVQDLLGADAIEPERLPICLLPDGAQLASATIEDVAAGLGLVAPPALADYDIAVIGAGPAGLAASVYAASEGLRSVAIEAVAPGGQAGTTSMIENYLGFPQGISGSELATRAAAQARRFGAEILLARTLRDIKQTGPTYVVQLSDNTNIRTQAVLVATGVDWRRLDVPGVDELLGAGVYYGAGPSEAVSCRGCRVMVVGGGNSAGQAVVRFSRYASQVTLLIRGQELGASMSQYLVDRVTSLQNVSVRLSTQVETLESNGHLTGVMVTSNEDGRGGRIPIDALFICIGGVPRTRGATTLGVATDAAGYLRTGYDLGPEAGPLAEWPLSRQPLPLETNLPGLFAAGDVRSGSIKRCSAAIGEGSMAVSLLHRRLEEVGGGSHD